MSANNFPHQALIALGSNLNQPESQINRALKHLSGTTGVTLIACSSLYQTQPVGFTEQPWFLNAVCLLRTVLSSKQLLQTMLGIERLQGRNRNQQERFGPRGIDLDLLAYDTQRMNSAELTLPHPRMHQRAFVIVPLQELVQAHPGLSGWVDSQLPVPLSQCHQHVLAMPDQRIKRYIPEKSEPQQLAHLQ